MKPVPVWQPTQEALPAGSVVVTACMELAHAALLMWWLGSSWHWLHAPELLGTEMATGKPPELAWTPPGPWQFSHWMLATFCKAAGIAAKLVGCRTVGNTQVNAAAREENPPSLT